MSILDIESVVVHPTGNGDRFLTILSLVFSTIGVALCAVSIALLFLTAILFVEWRRNFKNQLLIQFMTARFIYTFVRYFFDIQEVFGFCEKQNCIIYLDNFYFVYTELTLVTWMFVFTKQMYDSLVKVFIFENPNLWIVSMCAWFVPAFVSVVLYFGYYKQVNRDMCVFILYLLLLKWPILITNAVLLILILRSIINMNKGSAEKSARIIIVMIMVIFMFAVQQIIIDTYKLVYVVLLDNYSYVMHLYIATNIMTLYHCAFSILFWLFGNASTRKLWRFEKKSGRVNSLINVSINLKK